MSETIGLAMRAAFWTSVMFARAGRAESALVTGFYALSKSLVQARESTEVYRNG
jgi:hypothetical protein